MSDDTIEKLAYAIGRMPRVPLRLRVFKNENVPLQRTEEDGTVVDALCWKIDGVIHVHPDRWEMFCRLLGVEP